MPNDLELPSHLNIRIEPKLRYLIELAARTSGVTLTTYVEAALTKSLRDVYLDEDHQIDFGPGLKERHQELAPPVGTIAHYAEALWSDNPGKRLAIRCAYGSQLLSDEERKIWNYIMSQDDLAPKSGGGRKPNYRIIADRWHEIKIAALNTVSSQRAKVKK